MRLAGALAVVLIHVSSDGVARFGAIPRLDWWLCLLVDAASRWAVPLFVMLSGALLLDPSRDEPLGTFLRKRFSRVGLPLLFWAAFYLAWRVLYRGEEPSLLWAARSLAYGTPYQHLYFLYILVGLYLITPALRVFLRHSDRRTQLVYALIALGLGMTDKAVRTVWESAISGLLMFVPYTGYFMLGYWLREVSLDARQRRAAGMAWGGALLLMVLGTRLLFGWFERPALRYYALEFLAPTVVVMAVATFLLLAGWQRPSGPCLRYLANATLGIYLIHPALLAVFRDHGLTPYWHGALVGLPLSAALACLLSLALTALLQTIPGLRRVVG